MSDMHIEFSVFLGKTKKSVRGIGLKAHSFRRHESEGCFSYLMSLPGYLDADKEMRASTMFDAMVDILSTYKFVLVQERAKDSSLHYYVDVDGVLEKVDLADIFRTLAD